MDWSKIIIVIIGVVFFTPLLIYLCNHRANTLVNLCFPEKPSDNKLIFYGMSQPEILQFQQQKNQGKAYIGFKKKVSQSILNQLFNKPIKFCVDKQKINLQLDRFKEKQNIKFVLYHRPQDHKETFKYQSDGNTYMECLEQMFGKRVILLCLFDNIECVLFYTQELKPIFTKHSISRIKNILSELPQQSNLNHTLEEILETLQA